MMNKNQTHSQVYESSVQHCRWEFAKYLYSDTPKGMKNLPPISIQMKPISKECQKIKHRFCTTEERYGEAIMIFKMCLDCGCGIAEVNPPRRHSEPKKEALSNG